MAPPRKSPPAIHEPASHLVRCETWAGVHGGDPIDVLDARERRASWRFVAHVTNVQTGEEWVEVLGGKAGEQRRRSLRPDQVFPHRSLLRGVPTAASLSVAPRLTL